MKELFERLANDFADKEYAHSYMEGHAVSRIAAQVYALRRQRGWSQEELSKMSGLAQERISKIESADFSSLTMKTFHKLSRAFDVHLHIAFEPFTKGIADVGKLHREQLEVVSRAENLATRFSDESSWTRSGVSSATTPSQLLLMVLSPHQNVLLAIKPTEFSHALSSERAPRHEPIEISQRADTVGAQNG